MLFEKCKHKFWLVSYLIQVFEVIKFRQSYLQFYHFAVVGYGENVQAKETRDCQYFTGFDPFHCPSRKGQSL